MTLWNTLFYAQLRDYRIRQNLPWFTAAFDLNLVVLRSGTVGRWDDLTCWAFTDDAGRKCVELFVATGDAWEGEWVHPTHPNGCAYVLDQHVAGGYRIGKHHGRSALVQVKPFAFTRWPKGEGRPPTVAELETLPVWTDIRGFNLHDRVTGRTPERPATDDSESCTVHLFKHQHFAALELVAQQGARGLGDTVSVTFGKRADLAGL